MSRISQSASWTVPNGDFGALRLTAEVFMAHCGIDVQVRNGGTLIGKQGSSLASCLCLVLFAPVRLLPKRVRIDVAEERGQVQVQALLDDTFFLPRLSGLVAGRYRRQFDRWLEHLQGQVLPPDILDYDLGAEELEPETASGSANGHVRNGIVHPGTPVPAILALGEVSPEAHNGAEPLTALRAANGAHELTSTPGVTEADTQIIDSQEPEIPSIVDATNEVVSELGIAEARAEPPTRHAGVEPAAARRPEQGNTMSATSRRGFRLPRLGFGKRKLETAARKAGLPEEVRREAALGDQASEAKAWPRALTHYDAAIQTLTARSMEEGTEAGAVGDLYFRRGVARFNQAQTSLAAGQTERSVSDYQIAIEMIRLAAADYSEAIRLNPRWSMGYYRRGEAHLFAARCERGSRSFRRSSEELRSAVEDLTCATDRNPTFASAFALRAVAHALLENDQASEADIEKTVSLGIDPAVLRKAIQASKAWRA